MISAVEKPSPLRPVRKNCELIREEHPTLVPRLPAIDVHTHFGRMLLGENYESCYDTGQVVEQMKNLGLASVVNLDGEYGEYYDRMMRKTEKYADFITTFGSVDLTLFERPDFDQYVYSTIKRQVSLGMRGLKLWKILGLSVKDARGSYLRADDERLAVIWHTAAEFHLPVMIHIADPTAFFKPIDDKNERIDELRVHPDWSFHGGGFYSFEQLMEMQERLLASYPDTQFIVAHFGSYSENIAQVGCWLERYANMYVDIAFRINDLGRQPYTSRAFFEKYQERVLFGTDLSPLDLDYYPIFYRFLETFDEYFDYSPRPVPPQGDWKIYGIGLETDILARVYRENAVKILNLG